MGNTKKNVMKSRARKVDAGSAPSRGTKRTRATGKGVEGVTIKPSASSTDADISIVPPFEQRFTSEAAKDKYDKVFKHKGAIKERGLLDSAIPKSVSDEVKRRKWDFFAGPPSPPNLSQVREFFAECSQTASDTHVLTLRGKSVNFSPKAINYVCHTVSIPESEDFEAVLGRMQGDVLDKAKAFLCPNAAWITSKLNPLKRLALPASSLKPEAQVWRKFFMTRVRPTAHKNDIKPDEILLLYAVLNKIPIDVGRLIFRGIHTYAGRPSGNLLYPSIITELAQRAEVPIRDTDEVISKKPTRITTISSKARPHKRSRKEVQPPSLEELFRRDVYNIARSNQQWMERVRHDNVNTRALLDDIYKKLDGDPSKFPPVCPEPFEYPNFVYPYPFGPPEAFDEGSETEDEFVEPIDDDRDPLDVLLDKLGPGPSDVVASPVTGDDK